MICTAIFKHLIVLIHVKLSTKFSQIIIDGQKAGYVSQLLVGGDFSHSLPEAQ